MTVPPPQAIPWNQPQVLHLWWKSAPCFVPHNSVNIEFLRVQHLVPQCSDWRFVSCLLIHPLNLVFQRTYFGIFYLHTSSPLPQKSPSLLSLCTQCWHVGSLTSFQLTLSNSCKLGVVDRYLLGWLRISREIQFLFFWSEALYLHDVSFNRLTH